VDPLIVADINASGSITSLDATRVYQELSGNDRPEIPPLPAGIGPLVFNGPDPLVSLPRNLQAQAGDLITVPVNLDTAAGLDSVQLSLGYDDQALQLVSVRRGSLTLDFQWFVENRQPGVVSVDLSGLHPLTGGQGSLLELDFKVLATALAPVVIDLQSARLNDILAQSGQHPGRYLRGDRPPVGPPQRRLAHVLPSPQPSPRWREGVKALILKISYCKFFSDGGKLIHYLV
jgi:hypothetical protein